MTPPRKTKVVLIQIASIAISLALMASPPIIAHYLV
jgi:hypothetical protein